jgi:oligopeptide transport system ATP-binding protein
MMLNPLLQVQNLTTHFHTDDGTVYAVNGISYTLGEGETVGVVGESGCGKSVHAMSLIRLIAMPPGEIIDGSVVFQGRDLLTLSDREMRQVRGSEIAMTFQDPMTSLNPVLTIGQQISEALRRHMGLGRKAAHERAVELLEMVDIPEPEQRVDYYPHQLSGGMRQRAMIAMALSCEPTILIADEPTTALDVTIQAQIIDLVQKLRDSLDMSIIWITHDLGIMAGFAERIMVMYAGFIVEKAPVEALYADPRHPYTIGLLNSLPGAGGQQANERLQPIAGRPPDQRDMPMGCPFKQRCPFAVERCEEEMPSLEEIAPGHEIACWVDVREATPREVMA